MNTDSMPPSKNHPSPEAVSRRQQFGGLVQEIRHSLRAAAAKGVRGFECAPQTLELISRWGVPYKTGPESLEAIRADLGDCKRCRLSAQRHKIVFGDGNPAAELMFVGEGPGYDEDRSGQPFVGPAGQLLTRIIQAMGLTREEVYIGNIVKCRPPRNRNPQPDEIRICFPFLKRQIAAIRPHFVCALGGVAAQTLLDTSTPISRLRGRLHDYAGTQVMPTFHPSYLLRNPERKRAVWQDMQLVMKAMRTRNDGH